MLLPFLYIKELPNKGRAILTAQDIPKGSVIEICPVLILCVEDSKKIHQTSLHDYYFLWGITGETAIALGYGSIYNHSSTANADYEMLLDENNIRISAIRDISAGEEICFNYMDGGEQKSELWFEEK